MVNNQSLCLSLSYIMKISQKIDTADRITQKFAPCANSFLVKRNLLLDTT